MKTAQEYAQLKAGLKSALNKSGKKSRGIINDSIISIQNGKTVHPGSAEKRFIKIINGKYGFDVVRCSFVDEYFPSLCLLLRFDRVKSALNMKLEEHFCITENTELSVYDDDNFPAKPCQAQLDFERDFHDTCYMLVDDYSAFSHKSIKREKALIKFLDLKRCLLSSMLTWVFAITERIEKKYGLDEDSLKLYSCKYQTISILIESPDVWDRIFSMQDEFESTCFGVIKTVDKLNIITKDDIKFCYIKAFALSPDEYENALKNYERYWGFTDRW